MTPVITIFVRHNPACKHKGKAFHKGCDCPKHFRWYADGKQHFRKAGVRTWAEAERGKRDLEDTLSGKTPDEPKAGMLLSDAIDAFEGNKKEQGVAQKVQEQYSRELFRLRDFSERRGLVTVASALTLTNLIAFRSGWSVLYKSSFTRSVVQKRLNHFLRFCFNAGWLSRIPSLSTIKVSEPETMPLSDAEYAKLLEHAEGRTRALIELMRWSGLAIRDASTLKKTDLHFDDEKELYKIIRKRTKTGTPLYIPIPASVGKSLLEVLNGNPVYVFWNQTSAKSSPYGWAGHMGSLVTEVFNAAKIQSEGHLISHRLRATFAVDLLQKGVPLEHVSKLLGHSNVATTERHYAKWVKGRQDRLDNIVSATWASPK